MVPTRSQGAAANLARIEALQFEVVPFAAEEHAGAIRAQLPAVGTPMGLYDVSIAGQARARNLILVTHTIREFARVAQLTVED